MSGEDVVALVRRMDALWLRIDRGEATSEEIAEYAGLCDAADRLLGIDRVKEQAA